MFGPEDAQNHSEKPRLQSFHTTGTDRTEPPSYHVLAIKPQKPKNHSCTMFMKIAGQVSPNGRLAVGSPGSGSSTALIEKCCKSPTASDLVAIGETVCDTADLKKHRMSSPKTCREKTTDKSGDGTEPKSSNSGASGMTLTKQHKGKI
jgi:hypothetical protein